MKYLALLSSHFPTRISELITRINVKDIHYRLALKCCLIYNW